jgi:DNA repair ATPase RecN
MKVKRLEIKNIGLIADTAIELNKPLMLFYGEIMQGKTTILNAVRWCFGGSFPDDIIRHGQKTASVLLTFDGGSITREWHKAKDGTVSSSPISFIRDGKPVKRPVDEIKRMLNPFLLDQDFLRKMTELERSRYFVELFGVDTSELDKQISASESEARDLRVRVKMYGDIDLKEVKSVEVAPLVSDLNDQKRAYQLQLNDSGQKNKEIRSHNQQVSKAGSDVDEYNLLIKDLMEKLTYAQNKREDALTWLKENPIREEIPFPTPPDTSALESKISEAAATNVRAEQYQKNLKRSKEKEADENKVGELESKQRDLKRAKVAKLAEISSSCKIKGLAFDETGNFVFEGTSAGMLSGSQIMRLSEELSNLYPKDLGIGLIDRAESLGKSVFLLIDRAKEEDKTILATVVGERPAEVPEEVGVWIVEKGEVKS